MRLLLYEYKLDKRHIDESSACHGEDHLLFPQVKDYRDCDADQFGDTVGVCEN